MEQLKVYQNICKNITDKRWDAVWGDSYFLTNGRKIRKQLVKYGDFDDNVCLAKGVRPSNVQHAADLAFTGV